MLKIISLFTIVVFLLMHSPQPCFPQSIKEDAIYLFNSKQYDAAYKEFRRLIISSRADSEIYFYYGSSIFRKKEPNYRTALSYLIHATHGEKVPAKWFFELAVLCDTIEIKNLNIERLNVFNTAVINYRKVIRLNNGLVNDSYYALGKLYHRKQNLDSAIFCYEAIIKRNTKFTKDAKQRLIDALISRAEQFKNQNKLSDAKGLYKKILKLEPTHLEFKLRIGDINSDEDSVVPIEQYKSIYMNNMYWDSLCSVWEIGRPLRVDEGIWHFSVSVNTNNYEEMINNIDYYKAITNYDSCKIFLDSTKLYSIVHDNKKITNNSKIISIIKNTKSIKNSIINKFSISNQNTVTIIKTIDQFIEELENVRIAFNSPDTMEINEIRQIVLLISRDLSIMSLTSNLRDNFYDKSKIGAIHTASIKASAMMEAHLDGEKFTIKAITPIQQFVQKEGTTRWEWIIKAETKGTWTIFLTLNACIDYNGEKITQTIETYRKPIYVFVKSPTFFTSIYILIEKYLSGILGLIGIIIGAFLYHILALRREIIKQKNDKKTEEIGHSEETPSVKRIKKLKEPKQPKKVRSLKKDMQVEKFKNLKNPEIKIDNSE